MLPGSPIACKRALAQHMFSCHLGIPRKVLRLKTENLDKGFPDFPIQEPVPKLSLRMANRQQWIVLACSCLCAFSGNFFSEITTPLSRRLQGDSPACRNSASSSSATTSTTSSSSEEKPPDHCLDLSSTEYNSLSAAFTYATGFSAVYSALAIKQHGQRWMIWSAVP